MQSAISNTAIYIALLIGGLTALWALARLSVMIRRARDGGKLRRRHKVGHREIRIDSAPHASTTKISAQSRDAELIARRLIETEGAQQWPREKLKERVGGELLKRAYEEGTLPASLRKMYEAELQRRGPPS